MIKNIQKTLQEFIKVNDTIVIGISGGPDSVFLLNECLKFKEKHNIKIIIAHVNHKLRAKESDKDCEFVEKIANKNTLQFNLKTLSKKKTGNIEEYCRNERYKFFENIRKKSKAKWILTAHHLNDNIETILFNLTRGCFTSGLSGMEISDKKRHLLRPLLLVTKEEIIKYLKDNKISYRKDKSNNDKKYSRNLIRHKIIPELKKINPTIEKTFSQNIINFQELDSYLEKTTLQWLKNNFKKQQIQIESFKKLQPIIQKTALLYIYKGFYGHTRKFNLNHLKQILKIINQDQSNKKKEFGDRYMIGISKYKGKRIIIFKKKR